MNDIHRRKTIKMGTEREREEEEGEVLQCFRHLVGTCVQLLSPLIFCLESVLSGTFA